MTLKKEGAFRLLEFRAQEIARAAFHIQSPEGGLAFVATTERVRFNGVRYDAHVSVELVEVQGSEGDS